MVCYGFSSSLIYRYLILRVFEYNFKKDLAPLYKRRREGGKLCDCRDFAFFFVLLFQGKNGIDRKLEVSKAQECI